MITQGMWDVAGGILLAFGLLIGGVVALGTMAWAIYFIYSSVRDTALDRVDLAVMVIVIGLLLVIGLAAAIKLSL
jgi:hypothetical protein